MIKNKTLLGRIAGGIGILVLGLMSAVQVFAKTFVLPPVGSDVIGSTQYVYARDGESLADVGRRHGIGYYEMVNANKHLFSIRRLSSASKVFIPGRFILPPGPREGVVINLAELRLYYYPKGKNVVITHPVGIGRENGWETPTGTTKVTHKEKDPIWRPTWRVRKESAANGYPLPKVFPPGPDNPLGKYMLRLGWKTYLIHGTNQIQSIGGRVSAGCIRLLPKAIKELYHKVPIGTKVTVINQPYKTGWSHGRLYYEVHPPLAETEHLYNNRANKTNIINWVRSHQEGRRIKINDHAVRKMTHQETGIPEVVGM